MPPKYVFNHVCFYDEATDLWYVYHKLDKRISKNLECYPSDYIAKAENLDDAITMAVEKGVNRRDIQVIHNES